MRNDLHWHNVTLRLAVILFLTGAGLAGTPFGGAELQAQDKPDADKPAAEKPAAVEAEADPLAVPEGGIKELKAFIEKVQTTRVLPKSREEFEARRARQNAAILSAADRILSDAFADQRTADDSLFAMNLKLRTLKSLVSSDGKSGQEAFDSAVLEAINSPLAAVARRGRQYQLAATTVDLVGASKDEQQTFINDAVALFDGDVSLDTMSLLMNVGRNLEDLNLPELAGDYYRAMAGPVTGSDNERIARYGAKLPGMARRITLVGQPMEVTGQLLDGAEVDWASYRGKVVLVDFWATWCGPCRAELPNLKKNYEAYHAKGFDIVGVSFDTRRSAVETYIKESAIAWPTLYSDDPMANGWDHPLGTYYGVSSIPLNVLVDQEGRVISMKARGPELGRLLESLLGPVETKPATNDSDAKPNEDGADRK